MTSIRKMKPEDQTDLYEIAIRAFDEDYQNYGQYPPLMDTAAKRFRPSLKLGYTILYGEVIIGAVYFWQKGKAATLGAIFIDPNYQNKGIGKEVMRLAEEHLPSAAKRTLDTPYKAFRNHHFYESLGYKKVKEIQPDKNDPFRLFLYEKTI
jgi:ribosomal protein S18 acetylase RimI-like enzyme